VNIALERSIANVSAARLRMSGNEQATVGSVGFMRPIVVRMSCLVTQLRVTLASATVTYLVSSISSGGPCKPGLLTLPTITAALTHNPANVVEVCSRRLSSGEAQPDNCALLGVAESVMMNG